MWKKSQIPCFIRVFVFRNENDNYPAEKKLKDFFWSVITIWLSGTIIIIIIQFARQNPILAMQKNNRKLWQVWPKCYAKNWKKIKGVSIFNNSEKNLNPENLKHSKIIIICHFFQSAVTVKIKKFWSNWVWLVIIIISQSVSQSVSVMMTGWLAGWLQWWTLLDVKTTVVVDVDIVTLWFFCFVWKKFSCYST